MSAGKAARLSTGLSAEAEAGAKADADARLTTALFLGHEDPTFAREWRFAAGCVAFIAIGVAELAFLGRGNGTALLLQPLWSWLSSLSYASHLLFPGWMTLAVFVATCLYFTYLDLTRSESTKLQRDYWPSVEDILWASVPQVLTCELCVWVVVVVCVCGGGRRVSVCV